jgi:transposase InsO family protein
MPWKASTRVNLRREFLDRLAGGERMTDLCLEYGISRKTGHALANRHARWGETAFYEQSRAPHRSPQRTSEEVIERLVRARRKHPTWGAKKLRAWLARTAPGVSWPAPSTITGVLHRQGLIEPRRRRRTCEAFVGPLTQPNEANDVWCADFKGQFRLGSGEQCYPLTISDRSSRFLLACDAFNRIGIDDVIESFLTVFRECGMPHVIRTDNGVPFASQGVAGLSRLSVTWLRLGITPERIEPAHPEQNGQHERMHRVLKQETTRPAAHNLLGQQERFNRFVREYNVERPHEALDMKTPSELYVRSPRVMPNVVPDPSYPLHDDALRVHRSGRISILRTKVFVGTALGQQLVGIREIDESSWLVSFAGVDLGVWRKGEGKLST